MAIPPLVVQHSYTGLRGAIVSTVEIGIMRWELVIEIEPEELLDAFEKKLIEKRDRFLEDFEETGWNTSD